MTERCGFIALIGRPNVGKSTLVNQLMGQKVSITCRKAQTTQHQIQAIKTTEDAQFVYVDTPGIHEGGKRIIHRYINRAATSVLQDVDVIVLLVDATGIKEEDLAVIKLLDSVKCPVILVINKLDKLKKQDDILFFINQVKDLYAFKEIVPISALQDKNVAVLEKVVKQYLPESPFYFPPDQLTDKNENFYAAEIIREKILHYTHEELPYSVRVIVESLEESKKLVKIQALILVERESQKGMLVGREGHVLKTIGQAARLDLENYYQRKVFLQLWVKVKSNWADDEESLRHFGYGE